MYLKFVNVIIFKILVAFINLYQFISIFINFYQFIFCNILKINNKN